MVWRAMVYAARRCGGRTTVKGVYAPTGSVSSGLVWFGVVWCGVSGMTVVFSVQRLMLCCAFGMR